MIKNNAKDIKSTKAFIATSSITQKAKHFQLSISLKSHSIFIHKTLALSHAHTQTVRTERC